MREWGNRQNTLSDHRRNQRPQFSEQWAMRRGQLPAGKQKYVAAPAFSQLATARCPRLLFFQPRIAYSTPF
jgi:hypothetical protein